MDMQLLPHTVEMPCLTIPATPTKEKKIIYTQFKDIQPLSKGPLLILLR